MHEEPFGALMELQRAATARDCAKDEELKAAYDKIAELTAVVADLRAYVEMYVDIVDGNPNRAMQLVSRADEAIYGTECF